MSKKPGMDDLLQREFRSRSDLRKWLREHHARSESFWLVTFKRHVTPYYLAYGEVVEELLCFGWVDSRSRRLDDDRTMLLVAPRKAGSTWSAPNKRRVERLARDGRLHPAGQAKIDAAKKDGSWTFLDEIDRLEVPGDLAAAFRGQARARRNFDAFSPSARKIILLWLKTAKRPETRRKRVEETVRLAAKNVKAAHPEARGQ
jgi:uncharacterized protein YdeI (YjbR/CyaY-like superfamily)